jgi:glutathione peroxidase
MAASPFDDLQALDGGPLPGDTVAGKAVLVVNVASRCGLTPQYEGLERLQERFGERGFTVLGVPCNQFAGQEPGTAEEIREFCSATYGTTFPLTEKLEVNGEGRHPLFAWLSAEPDADGRAGEIEWNFEKFLVSPQGSVAARFRPTVGPEDDAIVAAIEAALAGPATRTVPAAEVAVGDRVLMPDGLALTVTRIDDEMLGGRDYIAFVEDSPARWLKLPMKRDGEVELLA